MAGIPQAFWPSSSTSSCSPSSLTASSTFSGLYSPPSVPLHATENTTYPWPPHSNPTCRTMPALPDWYSPPSSRFAPSTQEDRKVKEEEKKGPSEGDRRLSIEFLLNQPATSCTSSATSTVTSKQLDTSPTSTPFGKSDLPQHLLQQHQQQHIWRRETIAVYTLHEYPPTEEYDDHGKKAQQESTENLPSLRLWNPEEGAVGDDYDDDEYDEETGRKKHKTVLPPLHLRKKRRRLSREELQVLESVFLSNTTPDSFTKLKLAQMLYLSPQQVSNWFQNRRSKVRRELRASSSSPSKSNLTGGVMTAIHK